jgi:hypothetical protein
MASTTSLEVEEFYFRHALTIYRVNRLLHIPSELLLKGQFGAFQRLT